MSKLLEGIRVLDVTNVLAGPFCGYQFAQLGADVIKIEQTGSGDLARQLGADAALNRRGMGASFLAQNAGKRSFAVNLKHSQGKELFRALACSADVVLENLRPGVMERLELDYPRLRRENPRLVYCAITGFGQDGPMRTNPAYDQIVQGLSGVMSITGDPDSAPLRVGFPIADTIGGMTAAFAVAAALVRCARTGEGEFIDVSMMESTMAAMGWAISNLLIAGIPPSPMGNENFTASPSGTFRTGDGLLNIAANKQEQFIALCRIVGRPELIDDIRFNDREERKCHRATLRVLLEEALATDSAAAWEARLNADGIPAGRVLGVPEALDTEQVRGRGFVRHFNAVPGVERDVDVVRSGFRLATGDPGPATPPPVLGADTNAILDELGVDQAVRSHLKSEGVIQ